MYTDNDQKFPAGAPEWHASKVFTYLITWRAQLEILMLQSLWSVAQAREEVAYSVFHQS